jgi:AraC-like DNA-binding protein
MKPLLEDVRRKKGQDSFLAFELNKNTLDFFWHYHPEYELTLILEGKGKRLIGDHHEFFESGDLVLIGPDLPHTWVSERSAKEKCKAIVIQFSCDFITRFNGLEELTKIQKLLSNAALGLSFNENDLSFVKELIKNLHTQKNINKITNLLLILDELSTLKQAKLASTFYQPSKGNINEKRINIICQYIQKHASEGLNIQDAATLIHLSPSAFCKFFKRMTGKTFSDYVNDIRIVNSCSDLLSSEAKVAEIAYKNGFESLTYFNRIFLKKTNMKPSEYRKA